MSHLYENYDPDKDVCQNQNDFNMAVRNAIKYNMKQDVKQAKPYLIPYLVLWALFFVWALTLAMRVNRGPDRVLHMFFAMMASPLYVLAHYLGMMKN